MKRRRVRRTPDQAMDPQRDREDLRGCAQGDREAFERFYGRHHVRLHHYLFRIVGRREEADELLQELFLRIYRNAARYDPERGAVLSWVYRIAHNLAISRIRALSARPAGIDASEERIAVTPAKEPSPEREATRRDEARRVRKALMKLSPEQRSVLVLRHYEGMKFNEISDLLGIPLGTVKTRAMRGLRALTTHLEANTDDS